jgi:DNA excision repair protein ERCC-2
VPRGLFPYEFRDDQEEVFRFILEHVEEGPLLIQAPTGYGKTPVILAALLQLGYRVIWAVRTGNETDRPVEELLAINRLGPFFFGLSYRGKRDMCLLARDLRMKGDYQEVSFLCKQRMEECDYYIRLMGAGLEPLLESPMLYSQILRRCRSLGVCPYYAQREILPAASVVGLSYNYVIDEGMSWSVRRLFPFSESVLVVDEAHNLQQAAGNLNSDEVTLGSLSLARREVEVLGGRTIPDVLRLLGALEEELRSIHRSMNSVEAEVSIDVLLEAVADSLSTSIGGLRDFLSSLLRAGQRVRRERLARGKRPRSSAHHVAQFFLAALESRGVDGIAFIAQRRRRNLVLQRWDMRSAEILRDRWPLFRSVIFMSGTLGPFRAFAETVGLEDYRAKAVRSGFDLDRICCLIPRRLTTKGEELSADAASGYVEAIRAFLRGTDCNAAVFSASYRIQEDLLRAGLLEVVDGLGRRAFVEEQGMPGDRARRILEDFKAAAHSPRKGVLLASAAGRFAEGADFPGRELEAIFLVGIPFERMTLRTRLYLDYYRRLYGQEKGTYYAYVIPAMRRASQALGRALRSREDRAALVLGDKRYAQWRLKRLLPDFVRMTARLVDEGGIEEEVRAWSRGEVRNVLPKLHEAVRSRKRLKVAYVYRGKDVELEVEPIKVKGTTQLVARTSGGDIRNLQVDRIRQVEVLSTSSSSQ